MFLFRYLLLERYFLTNKKNKMNQPYFQTHNFTGNYQNQPYPFFQKGGNQELEKPNSFLNLLEIGIIIFLLLILLVVTVLGFSNQLAKLRDRNRQNEIEQIVWALNMFYENSSLVPNERKYPIAVCSGQLNEVDYEFTLRKYLKGEREEFDSHPYIQGQNPESFLVDNWGNYAVNLDQRSIPLRNCPNIFARNQDWGGLVYPDSFPSCQFRPSDKRFRNCYLYTSTTNGDGYEVGYFSESQQAFIIYYRHRDGNVGIKMQRV